LKALVENRAGKAEDGPEAREFVYNNFVRGIASRAARDTPAFRLPAVSTCKLRLQQREDIVAEAEAAGFRLDTGGKRLNIIMIADSNCDGKTIYF
jgi:hypothetical protein